MTTSGDDDIFAALENDADLRRASRSSTAAPIKADNRPTYPCERCAGSGTVTFGYRTIQLGTCRACKGRGFFFQAKETRFANRQATARRKAATVADKQAEFEQANDGLMDFLRGCDWSPFAKAMVEAFGRYGYLTEAQTKAANSMRAKHVERMNERAAKKAEALANAPAVDLSPIQAMFDKAAASGLKRTIYRAEGLVLSPAKAGGKNPGAIYVKTHGANEYLGKVVSGRFEALPCATDEQKAALQVIASNPGEAAIRWGQTMMCCSVCGIELTDPVSRARGIGPICAEKWGF